MGYSKQRECILAAVMQCHDHPTADEVYARIKPDNPKLSLGTVYRNLNMLAESGKIHKLELSGADRFDGIMEDHLHLVCKKCGCITNMKPNGKVKVEDVTPPDGCTVEDVRLTCYGLCKECASAK